MLLLLAVLTWHQRLHIYNFPSTFHPCSVWLWGGLHIQSLCDVLDRFSNTRCYDYHHDDLLCRHLLDILQERKTSFRRNHTTDKSTKKTTAEKTGSTTVHHIQSIYNLLDAIPYNSFFGPGKRNVTVVARSNCGANANQLIRKYIYIHVF